MAEQFIGCTISLEVGGGLGFYQGLVKSVNVQRQSITLAKVLHNGKPSPSIEVTINARDILALNVLSKKKIGVAEQKEEKERTSKQKAAEKLTSNKDKQVYPKNEQVINFESSPMTIPIKKQGHSPVGFKPLKLWEEKEHQPFASLSPSRHRKRATVGESLAVDHHTGSPCDRAYNYDNRQAANMFHESNYQRKYVDPKTPNRRQQFKKARDLTTFGSPIGGDEMNTEFDFEKNLALFDKQAVREEIEKSNKPDVVRQADKKSEKSYRWDESIIAPNSPKTRQIIVPATVAGEIVYTTDNGLMVPSVTTQMRLNLLSTANQHGLTKSRQLEMIGRASTEIILSLIGGSHRLEPGNSHQPPIVLLLCGVHIQGAAGANCGRQLESQGVRTVLATPPSATSPPPCLLFAQEMQLYRLTMGQVMSKSDFLPSTVDLIVDARFDLDGQVGVSAHNWLATTSLWASSSRAPVVALDPPSDLTPVVCPISTRIKLSPALPLAHFPDKGKVYLLNLNIPQQVFNECEIKYTSPFGAKMVIPLHPCE